MLLQVGASAIILWVLGKLRILDVDALELQTVSTLSHHHFSKSESPWAFDLGSWQACETSRGPSKRTAIKRHDLHSIVKGLLSLFCLSPRRYLEANLSLVARTSLFIAQSSTQRLQDYLTDVSQAKSFFWNAFAFMCLLYSNAKVIAPEMRHNSALESQEYASITTSPSDPIVALTQ